MNSLLNYEVIFLLFWYLVPIYLLFFIDVYEQAIITFFFVCVCVRMRLRCVWRNKKKTWRKRKKLRVIERRARNREREKDREEEKTTSMIIKCRHDCQKKKTAISDILRLLIRRKIGQW